MSGRQDVGEDLVGTVVELDVTAVAHGGHCVARLDTRVYFCRHTLPGERVRALVTEGTTTSRFLRADAVEVLTAAPGRVDPPCPYAHPGGCGGCDWQHADAGTQAGLLAAVVAEQLQRLAGIERDVIVEMPGGDELIGWRTRVGFAVDAEGRPGLRPHRSHDVLTVEQCLIAHPQLPVVLGHEWPADRVEAVVSSEGDRLVVLDPLRPAEIPLEGDTGAVGRDGRGLAGRTHVRESVHGRTFRVGGGAFWQVHPRAAETLVDAVLELGEPQPGERVADLYSGVGLFAAFLAERVGASGGVVAVESDAGAVRDARRNLFDSPQVQLETGRVERVLGGDQRFDLVVLDPPRVGAKRRVVESIVATQPGRVVYVACDPAAMARDVAIFAEHGYRLADLRAYALFPMTHHVECVVLLTKIT